MHVQHLKIDDTLTKKEEATNERKRAKKSNRGYCLCGSELLE